MKNGRREHHRSYDAPLDAETEAEIDAALEQAKEYEVYRPVAISARYDRDADGFVIAFASGAVLFVPRSILQGLGDMTPERAAKVRVNHLGTQLSWPRWKVAHYIPHLLEGAFGNRAWQTEIARRGGSVRSEAKARAARINGKKGGRPRRAA
ncbi:MAG: DUF2442 domain-containing protein [Vulcanimicrobiaceae bacterium]|jgi:hypothetical protein